MRRCAAILAALMLVAPATADAHRHHHKHKHHRHAHHVVVHHATSPSTPVAAVAPVEQQVAPEEVTQAEADALIAQGERECPEGTTDPSCIERVELHYETEAEADARQEHEAEEAAEH